jgi:hypothetical protein
MAEAVRGHEISHIGRNYAIVKFFVGRLIAGKRIEAQLLDCKIERDEEMGEDVGSDEAIGGADCFLV